MHSSIQFGHVEVWGFIMVNEWPVVFGRAGPRKKHRIDMAAAAAGRRWGKEEAGKIIKSKNCVLLRCLLLLRPFLFWPWQKWKKGGGEEEGGGKEEGGGTGGGPANEHQ